MIWAQYTVHMGVKWDTNVFLDNLKKRDGLEHLCTDGKITLRRSFRNKVEGYGSDLIGQDTVQW